MTTGYDIRPRQQGMTAGYDSKTAEYDIRARQQAMTFGFTADHASRGLTERLGWKAWAFSLGNIGTGVIHLAALSEQ